MTNMIKRWKKWLDSQRIYKKMIWIYILFGIIPMFIMAVYTYRTTKANLLDQVKRDVENELKWTAYGIEERFERLNLVMKQLSMDREWKECLKAYYAEQDINGLYEFTDELFDKYTVLYQDIKSLSLYGVEEEISSGSCYFYPLKTEEEPLWYEAVMNAGGTTIFHCELNQGKDGYNLMYLKELNVLGLGGAPVILKMEIVNSILNEFDSEQGSAARKVLLDKKGMVIYGQKRAWITHNLQEYFDEQKMMACWGELAPCGWICAIIDKENIGKTASKNAASVFFCYLGLSAIAFVCIEHSMDRVLKQRLERVKTGIEIIGRGDLSYRIPSAGSDEIGKIVDYLNDMTSQLELDIEESYKKELLVKEAELDLMQEQINSHFLYNSLSMIAAMDVNAGNEKGADMIRCLSEFYRISLNKGKKLLTVREEIELTKNYLKIQNARFGEIATMECNVAQDVLELYTLKLLLQPIVENAIYHGRENEADHLKLEVSVYSSRERVVFDIFDDGKGMAPEQLYEVSDSIIKGGRGYGLHNVNTRIRNYYGEDYGIYIESEYGFGTKITIEIPIDEEGPAMEEHRV